MQEYDYRISTESVNQAGAMIEQLSNKDLLKLCKAAESLKQSQEEERLAKGKAYFEAAVLPALRDFAELSESVLHVEEYDKSTSIEAVFKCELGYEIDENCRLMRSLLFMANWIGIMTEGKNTILTLIYDYRDLLN